MAASTPTGANLLSCLPTTEEDGITSYFPGGHRLAGVGLVYLECVGRQPKNVAFAMGCSFRVNNPITSACGLSEPLPWPQVKPTRIVETPPCPWITEIKIARGQRLRLRGGWILLLCCLASVWSLCSICRIGSFPRSRPWWTLEGFAPEDLTSLHVFLGAFSWLHIVWGYISFGKVTIGPEGPIWGKRSYRILKIAPEISARGF